MRVRCSLVLAILVTIFVNTEAILDTPVQNITFELQQKLIQILPALALGKIDEILKEPFKILPEFPDPLHLENFGFYVPEDSELGNEIYGELSVCNSSFNGLSTLEGTIKLGSQPLSIRYILDTGLLSFGGLYDAQLTVYAGDYVASGSGHFRGEIDAVFLNLTIVPVFFKPWNRVSIGDITIDLSFDSIELFAEDFVVNGEPYDWEELNSNLKPTFDALWPEFRPIVQDFVKKEVNSILLNCKFFDMLNEEFGCFSQSRGDGLLQRTISSLQSKSNVCPRIPRPIQSTTTIRTTTTKATTTASTESTTESNNAGSLKINIFVLSIVLLLFSV